VGHDLSEHVADLQRAGVYARHLRRFERDFARWMASDEGRFAAWCAQRTIGRGEAQPDRSG
jgi:hypothetical protein